MSKKYDFEYIIIGSGPAGSAAAFTLKKSKKQRIALVEGQALGGSNLNSYDISSAIDFNFIHTYTKVTSDPDFRNNDFSFNFSSRISRTVKTINDIRRATEQSFKDAGIVYFNQFANFLDDHTIAIGGKKFTSEYFILATGSHLKTREISGTDTVNYLTPATALKLRRLPEVAVIVGAGSTGCELANYFATLGVKVFLLDIAKRLLPKEDKEASDLITQHFSNHLGIEFLPNCKVVALENEPTCKRVIFRHSNTEKMIRTDCVILATGNEPNLDFGLENAKVKYKNTGITVNKSFQTSAKNIFAIGDCIGGESSTERAYSEGTLLAANLINKTKSLMDYHGFPRITNICPTVATIGLNEDDLMRRDRKYHKALVKLSDIPASNIYHFDTGFVKLLTDRNYHLVGACIVAPHAELLAGEVAIAIRHQLTTVELASTPQVMNSYGYAIKLAAKKLLPKK